MNYQRTLMQLAQMADDGAFRDAIEEGTLRNDAMSFIAVAIWAPTEPEPTLQWLISTSSVANLVNARATEPHGWTALQNVLFIGCYTRAHLLLNLGATALELTRDNLSVLELLSEDKRGVAHPNIAPVRVELLQRREPMDYGLVKRLLAAGARPPSVRYQGKWWSVYVGRRRNAQTTTLAVLAVAKRYPERRDVLGLIARCLYDTRDQAAWSWSQGWCWQWCTKGAQTSW
jgi:hypothetical protein